MNKTVGIIIAVLVLAGGAYYLANRNQATAPSNEETNQNQSQSNDGASDSQSDTATSTTETGSGAGVNVGAGAGVNVEEQIDGPDIQVVEIAYDGKAFTPSEVKIKVNDYVIFKNNSTTDFWPASGPHPSHTNYPEFDPKKRVAAGDKFQFQFTKEGEWAFHDHLNPSARGKVTVTK